MRGGKGGRDRVECKGRGRVGKEREGWKMEGKGGEVNTVAIFTFGSSLGSFWCAGLSSSLPLPVSTEIWQDGGKGGGENGWMKGEGRERKKRQWQEGVRGKGCELLQD